LDTSPATRVSSSIRDAGTSHRGVGLESSRAIDLLSCLDVPPNRSRFWCIDLMQGRGEASSRQRLDPDGWLMRIE